MKRRDHAKHAAAVRAALARRVSLDKALVDAVSPAAMGRVVARLLSIINDGEAKAACSAAKVLLAHVVPKRPAQFGEVGRPAGGGNTFVFQLPADPVEQARRLVANEAAGGRG